MRVLVLVALVSILALAAPAQATATGKDYGFSNLPSAIVPTAHQLVDPDTPGGDVAPIAMSANTPLLFVQDTPLATGAHFTGGDFRFDGYFSSATGAISVAWGYLDPVTHAFRPLAAGSVANANCNVRSEGRSTLPGTVTARIPSTVDPVDVGHAVCVKTGLDGVIPKNAYPAIQITSTNDNGFFPTANVLGANTNAAASIPLPELPAIALLSLGALVVGGVFYVRRR